MQNINKIKSLIKDRKLTIKSVREQIKYSQSGFDKAIEQQSFKTEALIKLTEILKLDSNYFFGEIKKYANDELSVVEETQKGYVKINTDDLL